MEKTQKSSSIVKNGALGIILVGESEDLFNQEFIIVEDYNDRNRGDGIKMFGLPGGGIEKGEKSYKGFLREMFEEISLDFKLCTFKKFGCYKKLRPNGLTNDNYLFVIRLNYVPVLITNDPKEVSKVHILKLKDIIKLAEKGIFHEGSIRLIFHYLNGNKSGSLNEPVSFNSITF